MVHKFISFLFCFATATLAAAIIKINENENCVSKTTKQSRGPSKQFYSILFQGSARTIYAETEGSDLEESLATRQGHPVFSFSHKAVHKGHMQQVCWVVSDTPYSEEKWNLKLLIAQREAEVGNGQAYGDSHHTGTRRRGGQASF
jgi:hypothetical protein